MKAVLGCEKGRDHGSVGGPRRALFQLPLAAACPSRLCPFRRRVTLYVPASLQACQSHTAVRTRARVVQRADPENTRLPSLFGPTLFARSQPQRNSLNRTPLAMAPKADKKAASSTDPSYDYKPDEIVRGCCLFSIRRRLSPQTARTASVPRAHRRGSRDECST